MNLKIPDDLKERLIWAKPHGASTEEELFFPYVVEVLPLPCGDCGKQLKKTRIVDSRPVDVLQTWSTVCRACGLYQNPDTGKFDLTNQQLRALIAEKNKKRNK